MADARDLAIDLVTRELAVRDGDLVLVSGIEAIRQDIDMRLRTFLGEWFLDEREGVDYLGKILTKAPSTEQIRGEIRRVLLGTARVTQITALDLDFRRGSRTLRIVWSALTDLGQASGETTQAG